MHGMILMMEETQHLRDRERGKRTDHRATEFSAKSARENPAYAGRPELIQ